jgi:hypothetical protein
VDPWVRTFTPILARHRADALPVVPVGQHCGRAHLGVALVVLGHLSAANDGLRTTSYAVAGCFVVGSFALATLGWWRRRRSVGAAR